jgi:hypothetical protein
MGVFWVLYSTEPRARSKEETTSSPLPALTSPLYRAPRVYTICENALALHGAKSTRKGENRGILGTHPQISVEIAYFALTNVRKGLKVDIGAVLRTRMNTGVSSAAER